MLCIVSALGFKANAQTDVTSTYLTNYDFSIGTPIDNHVCTYGKDMAANGTTYYGAQSISGWTNASVGETDSGYPDSKLAGALFAYGGTPWLAGSGTTAPATGPNGNAGNAAGLCAVWGGTIRYTQNVTLPAGHYTVKFQVYNSTTNNGSGKFITSNLFGFDADAGDDYYSPATTFAIGQWTTVTVTFTLATETSGKISMGYVGPSGNANMPHLFVDNVKILSNTDNTDKTSSVGLQANTNWINASDGMQGSGYTTDDGRSAGCAARYGTSAVSNNVIYQDITVEEGNYEVEVYALSQNEWNNNGASLQNDKGDAIYVFATGMSTVKTYINARRGPGINKNEGPKVYSISNVITEDGNLRIGLGIDIANQTEWHMIQIKSLKRVGSSFEALVIAYETALANAKTLAATIEKMSATALSALNTAIDTYDEGKVNKSDKDAVTAAANALNTAIDNASTSISAYSSINTAISTYATKAAALDAAGQAAYDDSDIQTKYDNGTYETLSEAESELQAAYTSAVKSQSEGSDWTGLITNPSFETGNLNGWSVVASADTWARSTTNDTYKMTGSDGDYLFNTWSAGNEISQTLSAMPAGVYQLTAVMATDAGHTLQLKMGGKTAEAASVEKGTGVEFSVEATLATDGNLTISAVTADNYWYKADNFRLTFVASISLQILYDQITALVAQAAGITGKQSDATASELNDAVTEGNALVDGGSTDIDALNASIDRLTDAIAASSTSVHSYAVIAAGSVPDNSVEGWVCENPQGIHVNTWSVEGNSDGSNMVTPFIENWVANGSYLGAGRVYYQLQGLNPGEVYYAQALVRSYNEKNADAPNGPNFFINSKEVDMTEVGTTFTYNGMSGIYATLGGAAEVGLDGTLTLGVRIAEDRNYNWVAFKNVSIQPMHNALVAAVNNAEALYPSLPTAAKAALKDVVDANSDDSGYTTAAQYETAIGNISEAIDIATPFIAPYTSWLSVKSSAESLFADYDYMLAIVSTDNAAVEAADNPSTITACTTEVTNAMNAYNAYVETTPIAESLGLVVIPVTTYETVADLQSAVEFLNVEEYDAVTTSYTYDATEWLGDWENAPGTTQGQSWDGTDGDRYLDEYNKAARNMTQTITLPKAKYVLFAKGRASVNGSITLSDGTTTVTFPHKNDVGLGITTEGEACFTSHAIDDTKEYANSNNGRGWEYRFLTFESDGSTPITLTFAWTTASYNWAGLDDITLKAIPEEETIDETVDFNNEYELANVTLKRTIKAGTWNTFVVPFDINNSELVAAFGADVAVAEYSEVADGDNSTISFNTMAEPAIEANVPVVLKTSTAGTNYYFANRIIASSLPITLGTNFDFKGSYAASLTLANGDYFLSNNQVRKIEGATVTLKGTRAFIAPKTASAKILDFVIDGQASDVDAPEVVETEEPEVLFNMAGIQVDKNFKGVVINQKGEKRLQNK